MNAPGDVVVQGGYAIDIRDLRRAFVTRTGSVTEALAGISLGIRPGERLAVLGPSGCGKSSLLRILAGLDEQYDGTIDWAIDKSGPRRKRLRSATVFQMDSTLPWMTVEKNLLLGMSGLDLDASETEERITRFLSLVGLADFRHAYPHELSGGMRQRVAIARALATEPQLLLMDEPLAALDAQTRIIMQQELLTIWSQVEPTVVYVTHDIAEALSLADRIVVMTARPGRIKALIDVPFGRERDIGALRGEHAFGELETRLWSLVADEVGLTLKRTARAGGMDA